MIDLPRGWSHTTIGEVAELRLGKMLDRTKNRGDLTPYLRNLNVRWGSFDLTDIAQMRMSSDERRELDIRDGDLIVCEGGEPGRAAVWTLGSNAFAFQKALIRIRPYLGISAAFIAYFLRHLGVSGTINSYLSGTTIKHLPQAVLSKLSLPLPPAAEQKRIVAKLDALAIRSRKAREELSHAEEIAKKTKNLALEASTGKQASDFPLPGKTETWELTSVAGVANAVFDGPFGSNLKSKDYVDSGVRVIRLENIGQLRFLDHKTYISFEKFAYLSRHELQPDDILFSSFISDEVRVCIFPGCEVPAINKADCFCIRVDRHRCDPEFLAFRLSSPSGQQELKALVHGATRPRITLSQLKNFAFELPPLSEQHRIVDYAKKVLTQIDATSTETLQALLELEQLEKNTLERAFAGLLTSEEPDDEPANALLARIRAERGTQSSRSSKRRKTDYSKVPMMDSLKERIVKDSENWPEEGLNFDELQGRIQADYESIKSALFELLSKPSPVLRQRFDSQNRIMKIMRAK